MRRWHKEVALAVLLTIAAIAFIATAILRGDGASPEAPYATARKPAHELSAAKSRCARPPAIRSTSNSARLKRRYCAVQPPSIE